MSKGNLIKHLTFTLSRTLNHRHQPPSSLSLLTKPISLPPFQSKPTSSLFSPSLFFRFCSSSYTASSPDASTNVQSSSYLSVRIQCPKDIPDEFSEALLCFGAYSTSVDQDDESKDPSEINIDSIFPECEDVDMLLSQAANSIGLTQKPKYKIKIGEQWDWIRKTQESFEPVEVSEGIWIVPEWRSPPDAQATNIILNPGLAFGTGEHATTKLCLSLLQNLIKGGEQLLDYGTGSGILAIAALKFGASRSVGFDIDPQAITSARHNAALNNIAPEELELHLVSGEASSNIIEYSDTKVKDGSVDRTRATYESGTFDVVVANILLNPLLKLADHIVSFAKPGATVALSGILTEQVPHIKRRYADLLEGIKVLEMADWACVSGRKKVGADIS